MNKQLYDKINGKPVYAYTLANEKICVQIVEFGARVNALKVKGKDIVLGFDSISEYLESGTFAGAVIGRCANRIRGGMFMLNGKLYSLGCNEGCNHLHGGTFGFDKQLFEAVKCDDKCVELQYISRDGDEGYPGRLVFTVTYTLEDNALKIQFNAISDKDTLFNPTNHMYFNLDGEESDNCLNNLVQINSDFYTSADAELIPTGARTFVGETPFDFRGARPVNFDFGNPQLKATNGYDHNYIVNGEFMAYAKSVKTGIRMDIYSDMPCIQFYTGGAIRECRGKSHVYGKWSGFCLEPQYCPNAINMDGFDKPVLKAGEAKTHYIKYIFS